MIELRNLTKKFEDKTVIEDFSLSIKEGEHIAIMGESGKGKTTLLRIIAFLEKPDSGLVEGVTPETISYAFQEPRLFPTLSALKNMTVVSEEDRTVAQTKAQALLSAVGLGDAMNKKPHELSGGMRQRVSLARAFMVDRPILLLDEPFSALDEETRDSMIDFVKEASKNKTVIMVTHNREDALKLCGRIVEI